tara:strand:+ start:3258 stop:3893 length:636 start_codon:yes stop_codon:yes gene_type:complete
MKYNKFRWEVDLVKDIRFHNEVDDIDELWVVEPSVGYGSPLPFEEFTECNKINLISEFYRNENSIKCILEIGVHRNSNELSSTFCFLDNKDDEVFYFGVDVEDKSYLNNESKRIFTIQDSSSNYERVVNEINARGVEKIDFIFIDGHHSINQVLRDWEYVNILSQHGTVGFHDVSFHAGPNLFVSNLNGDLWNYSGNKCLSDFGIGFVKRK